MYLWHAVGQHFEASQSLALGGILTRPPICFRQCCKFVLYLTEIYRDVLEIKLAKSLSDNVHSHYSTY